MVEGNPKWRARVVYGDTDSLFVLLPGRSRDEAFEIGNEIAAAATAANPPPVTLKMEKVPQSAADTIDQIIMELKAPLDTASCIAVMIEYRWMYILLSIQACTS